MDGLGRSTVTRLTRGAVATLLALALAPSGLAATASPASAAQHRVKVHDQTRESGASHVDVAHATLNNGRHRLRVGLRFRSLRLTGLEQIVVGIDVNGSQRGFLIRLTPSRKRLRATLSSAVLYSDGSTARRITCPGMRVSGTSGRTVQVSVPRRCMRRGGDLARFHWFVSDRHGHHDASPWNGTGFSRWTRRVR